MAINTPARSIAYYAIGLIATKIISLLVVPIMTRFLSPTEYGNLEVLLTFINLASIVIGFGLTEAIFRFGGMAKTPQLMNVICSNATTMSLLIGCMLSSPIIIFANQISNILPGKITSLQVIYLGLTLIPANVLVVQMDWLRLKEDTTRFVWVNFLRSLLQSILVLLSLYLGYGVSGIMLASAITTSSVMLYFLLFQFDTPLQLNLSLQKKLFFYGLPLSFNGIAEFILLSLSYWWLAYDIGPKQMALYALAMKFSMLISLLIQPFYMWWDPTRYKHLNTKNSRRYTAFTSELGVTICYIGAYGVSIGGSLFILWFIPSNYHHAIAYLPLSCFALVLKYAADMMNTGLFLKKPTYIMLINTSMAILTIIGFYFFIPFWHIWGVLLILHLTLLIRWIAYAYLSQKELQLPYRYLSLIPFIFISELFGLSVHWMKNSLDYIVIGGGLFIIQIGLAYYLRLLPLLKIKKIMQNK